jgi:hypothetical protein
MQTELAGTTIHILGVNQFTSVSGNQQNCDGRDIPWLQEDQTSNVQGQWGALYRDVVILDADNVPVAVYNLTAHDLAVPANYDELKALLQSY